MRRAIRILLALAVVAGIAGFAYWFYWLRPEETRNARLVLYGNVDIRQVDLGFRVAGRIAEMRFEEGDVVTAGQVMAVLDKRPFEDDVRLAEADVAAQTATLEKYEAGSRPAEIAQARALVAERKATLDNAVLVLKRQEELVKRGNVSQQAYDNALAQKNEVQAQLQSARAALELAVEGFRKEDIAAARANLQMAEARLASAETNLADTAIAAPADGVILTRIQEPGAIVAAGAPVYTLSLRNPVWVRAYVREPDLGRVHPGMRALVTTDTAPQHPYHGHIGFISPVAEFTPKTVETTALRTDLVYRLRVIVDDPDESLRQGMPVTVTLPAEETAK
jgi:HlyD family secretion protein